MKARSIVAAFVLVQCFFLLFALSRFMLSGPRPGVLIAIPVLILFGIYRSDADWARSAGSVAGMLQAAFGVVIAVLAVFEILTFSLSGLARLGGAVLTIALGLWTISTMKVMARAHSNAAS